MSSEKPDYVMGHTERERRRLALQAAVINPLTDSFLRHAGISAGMHVLELGCGIGEVSLITARLVGPHGHVRCLDIDPAALEIARGRIRSAGHDHVKFEQTDINGHASDYRYDAVIGRHILIHTPDPLAILRKAVSMVHTGGVIAFQEFDLSVCPRSCPDLPLSYFATNLLVKLFCRIVPNPAMGAQLFHLMHEAGLPPPECRRESIMDGGPFSPVYEWLAETVRSLLPRMEEIGLTTAAEVDVDTLAQRMREEALKIRSAVVVCPMIGAFARKPR